MRSTNKRQVFLDGRGLRPSRGKPSVARVAGKRFCPRTVSRQERHGLRYETTYYPRALGWFDHTELFYGPNGYVLTTQPYDLTQEKLTALEALCFELGITATVLEADGWHNPKYCPLVVLHKGELRGGSEG